MVDGIDNNTVFFNRDVVRPSVDSLEEFYVLTNAPGAEHGRNMGGVLTVINKSAASLGVSGPGARLDPGGGGYRHRDVRFKWDRIVPREAISQRTEFATATV